MKRPYHYRRHESLLHLAWKSLMPEVWIELVGGPADGRVLRMVPAVMVRVPRSVEEDILRIPLSPEEWPIKKEERMRVLAYARTPISGKDVFIGDREHPIPYLYLGVET